MEYFRGHSHGVVPALMNNLIVTESYTDEIDPLFIGRDGVDNASCSSHDVTEDSKKAEEEAKEDDD